MCLATQDVQADEGEQPGMQKLISWKFKSTDRFELQAIIKLQSQLIYFCTWLINFMDWVLVFIHFWYVHSEAYISVF